MIALASLLIATVLLIAMVGAIQVAILAFRNPFRPAWLKRPGMDNAAAVIITTGVSIVIGYGINALIEVGLPAILTIVAVPTFAASVAYAVWRLFDCRERLRRTDAGQSPFYPVGRRRDVPGTPMGA